MTNNELQPYEEPQVTSFSQDELLESVEAYGFPTLPGAP